MTMYRMSSTILRFRHLLEKHKLTEAIFVEVRALLEERRLLLKSGTCIVDADASSKRRASTQIADGEREFGAVRLDAEG